MPDDRLTIDDFSGRIGQKFSVTPQEGEPFELELQTAERATHSDAETWEKEHGRVPFSMTFRAPGQEQHHPQQTFAVQHGEMGSFDLFLVPLGPDAEGQRYQAVFG